LSKEDVANGKTKGAALYSSRWPSNKVYYRFSEGFPYTQKVLDAMAHIEQHTHVQFFARGSGDYIEFITHPTSAYSDAIGKKGGRQVIALPHWATVGTAIHEIYHALGVYHEQSRTDRASAIIVNRENIPSDWRSQYDTWAERGDNGFNFYAFDFGSIMLYPSISYEDGWSMTRLDGTPFSAQREALSPTDIALMNTTMYPRIAATITGPTSILSGMKPGKQFYTYSINFGSDPYSTNCTWTIRAANGGIQTIPGTSNSISLTTRVNNAIKDGVNEVNYVEVHCMPSNQYLWLAVTVKDGYELSYSGTPPTLPELPE
jgi:hypothetical protein